MTEGNAGASNDDTPRGGDGRFVTPPDTVERDAEAARLRGRGKSWKAIADELGYADPSGAYRAGKRAMERIVREPAEEMRTYELDRLDHLYEKTLEVIDRRHIVVSGNQRHDDLVDDKPLLDAVTQALKIQERRARLLGLDAPQRLSVDAENIGREVLELLSDLDRLRSGKEKPDGDDG